MLYQGPFPIMANEEVMPGVRSLRFEAPAVARAARPGQFVRVGCGEGSGMLLRRPISISRASGGTVSLLFAVTGQGTQRIAALQTGQTVDVLGPLGNGFSILPGSRKLLLVGGGLGIAPLCFLAEVEAGIGRAVRLLTGARTACQTCPPPFLPEGAECLVATEDGTAGRQGMVTDLVAEHLDWADQIFACGPVPMYLSMEKQLPSWPAAKTVQVSLEVRMGCGLGICYSCTIRTRKGPKQVCKDGPVFDLRDILWDEVKV